MTKMLDKAAEALCARTEGRDDVWPDLSIRERDGFRDLARAVIFAIREPDNLDVGLAFRTKWPKSRPDVGPYKGRFMSVIDAILEGEA
jgi:hypothetical protein